MSARKCGQFAVHLVDGDGVGHWFNPGDLYPDWAVAQITNPLAFEDTDGLDDDLDDATPAAPIVEVGPPPHAGPGATKAAWFDYAVRYGVHVEHSWDRKEIIAAVKAAGITV